jgi:hypothetical protein
MHQENKLEELAGKFEGYLSTSYELTVLKASEKISKIVSEIASRFLVIPVLVFSILFLSLGAAYYISILMENRFIGFLIVGGAYFVIGMIILAFRKSLLANPLRNRIIREMFKED